MEPLPADYQKPTIGNINRVFLHAKPASSSLPLEDVHYRQRAGMGESGGTFRFGTLSSLVGHRARTAYLPLPAWAEKDSSSSLRDPSKRDISCPTDAEATKNREDQGSGFYEDSVGSSGDSESSSDSSFSADNSSSDEDNSSYDGDVNVKGREESSTSDDSSDDGSNEARKTMPSQPFVSQTQLSVMGNLPPDSILPQPMVSTVDSDSVSSSGSSSYSRSSSSSDEAAATAASTEGVGNLIPLAGTMQSTAATGPKSSGPTTSSAVEDLRGLVLEPVVVNVSDIGEPNMEHDSSAWLHLVRSHHGGGLAVKARYLRGKTKSREVQLMGLTAEKPSTVCLQVRFENKCVCLVSCGHVVCCLTSWFCVIQAC
jgi:hypothetical protein